MAVDGDKVVTGGGKGGVEYGCENAVEAHQYKDGKFLTVPGAGAGPFRDR